MSDEPAPTEVWVEVPPPIARVLKAELEDAEVAPVYVLAPSQEADWFSTASVEDEAVTRSKSE